MTRREAPVSPPVVLSIAGSDSGGGAGIQADVKTIEATGGFGTSAITSVTAQNTRGVEGSHMLPTADIRAQIEAVCGDFDVAAVKTGMLATAEVVDLVAEFAPDLPNLVVDPVMVATSGDRLLEVDAEAAYEALIAEATLVTPNADEATVLTDVPVEDEDSAVHAGTVLVEQQGADAALVKGGHVPGGGVRDVLVGSDGVTTIRHDRIRTDATHGSGCTLSAAIATELAHGADLTAAVTAGIGLLGAAVRYNVDVGEGPGSVHHLVALRNDASLGETISSLSTVSRETDDVLDAIAGPPGIAVAAATRYAEEPADVVALDVVSTPGGDGRTSDGGAQTGDGRTAAPTIRVGTDEPVARALLAAREVSPAIRFALACRHDDDVAGALDALDEAVVATVDETDDTPSRDAGEDSANASDAIDQQVTRAFETATKSPVAAGLPAAPNGPTAFVFAPSAGALLERTRALVAEL